MELRIVSYKNNDESFCFGIEKKQEIIPKLREYLEKCGEKYPDEFFRKDMDKVGEEKYYEIDEDVNNMRDEVQSFVENKIFLFWGDKIVFVTAIFKKEDKEKALDTFKQVFKI